MEAVTSAQAGLIATKTPLGFSIEKISDGQIVNAGPRDLGYFFLGCNDLKYSRVSSLDAVRESARFSWAAERALVLFLFMLDPSETEEEISEAANEIEKLLAVGPKVSELVEYSLYAHELPQPIAYSRIVSAAKDSTETLRLLDAFLQHQPIIAHVRLAYNNIPEELFSGEDRRKIHRLAIDRGLVWLLVREASSDRGIDSALFSLYSELRDQANSRAIVKEWTEGFKRTPRVKTDWTELTEPPAPSELSGANVRWRQALESALRQQDAIIQKVRAGDVEGARRFAADLVRQQKQDSEPEHLAKSLTRLSKEARDLEAYELSLEWAREATSYKPDDPRTHSQLAEAYVHFGRFAEAYDSLDKAEAFGDAAFAATFRARILRLQNRLPEALAAYEKARDDYVGTEDEPYNWAGVAEVLRDLGRLDDALAAYEAAARKFPDVEAIQNGLAATLAELGRFDDALREYQASVKRTYGVVARNGIAAIHKTMGQLDRAAALYSEIARDEPRDVVCRCGLVDVLEALGRKEEAIDLARETVQMFPESGNALQALGDSFRDAERLKEAADVYKEGVEKFPFDPYFPSSLAQVDRIRGRYDDALATYDEAARKFPSDRRIEAGRAAMLRRLGRAEEALVVYDRILASNKSLRFATNAKASLLIYTGRYEEALPILKMDNPRTQDEWRSFLLRAHLDLKTGYLKASAERLQWGAEHVPFERVRKMMLAALASVHLRLGRAEEAVTISRECERDLTAIVRFHALASAEQRGPAKALYEVLRQSFVPERYAELREEIARHYGVVLLTPKRPTAWIFEAESDALLLEAA